MHLGAEDFKNFEAVTPQAFSFLSKLAEKTPELADVCRSLSYLDVLTKNAQTEDALDLRHELLILAEGLQKRVFEVQLHDNLEWIEESQIQDIDRLFNSLPKDLLEKHNQTLQQLLAPVEAETEVPLDRPNNPVVEDLKTAITTDVLAVVKPESLPPTLLDKLKSKAKLTPKQLLQVLAACAALSLPSDRIQLDPGPEVMSRLPEKTTQLVQHRVEEQLSFNFSAPDPVVQMVAPAPLPEPSLQDRAFELQETIPLPQALVNEQRADSPPGAKRRVGMNNRFANAMRLPHKRELFYDMHHDGRLDPLVSILAMVESNVDPDAESKSGAMGMMQDMGELQGAFGDPKTLALLTKHGLMPQIDNKNYQKALKHGPISLINFLKKEKTGKTQFWKDFLQSQARLIKSPETGQRIAHYYIQSLRHQATKLTGIKDPTHLENQYIAAGGYNAGMGSMRRLKGIMARHDIANFTTDTALTFLNQEKLPLGITLRRGTYDEMNHYILRTIGMVEIIEEQNTVALTT